MKPYRSLGILTKVLVTVMVACAALQLLLAGMDLLGGWWLQGWHEEAFEPTGALGILFIFVFAALAIAQVPVTLGSHLTFMVWMNLASHNARALGARGMKWSPRWAVVCWLIPIVNLGLPVEVMKELHLASDPHAGDEGWSKGAPSRWIGPWWIGFLGALFFRVLSGKVLDDGMGELAAWVGLVIACCWLISAVCGGLVVLEIARRQADKRGHQQAPPVAAAAGRASRLILGGIAPCSELCHPRRHP